MGRRYVQSQYLCLDSTWFRKLPANLCPVWVPSIDSRSLVCWLARTEYAISNWPSLVPTPKAYNAHH